MPKRPAQGEEPRAKRLKLEPTTPFGPEIACAANWLLGGPVHVPGLVDLITAYFYTLQGNMQYRLNGVDKDIAVLPDGTIVSGGYNHAVGGSVIGWANGDCLFKFEAHIDRVQKLIVLPGPKIISASWDFVVRVMDVESGSMMDLRGHTGFVMDVAKLPDGNIASCSFDNTLRVWDPLSGDCLHSTTCLTSSLFMLYVAPDGTLMSGSLDGCIRVWNSAGCVCLLTLEGHTDCITGLTVMPDGTLASCSYDKTVRLWDLQTGVCVRTIPCEGRVRDMTVLENGLLASCDDKNVRLWTQDGVCVLTLEGHTAAVSCVALLPDGRLVSGSYDNTVRVWDIESGACPLVLRGHEKSVFKLIVLPDGRLASASWDDTFILWG
jgi:WD40 repeat protein